MTLHKSALGSILGFLIGPVTVIGTRFSGGTAIAFRQMTMRQRLAAAVRGEPHDRVPFAFYDGLLPREELRSLLGEGNIGEIRWCGCHRLEAPRCRFVEEKCFIDGREGIRTVLHTPRGKLSREALREPAYGTVTAHKHFVKDLADYDVLDAYLEDCAVSYTPDNYHTALAELGENGVALVPLTRSSWQQLWVEWVSIEDLSWHFAENEDRVMHTIALLERQQRAVFDCVAQIEALYVVFPDNVTAPMIGPGKFERFLLPMYRELSARMAEHGTPVFSHMDGDLKPLRDMIARSGLSGIDSFSPAPDNDTTVGEALERWPQMRLFMNFPSSVHLMDEESIRRHTREILAQGGDSGRIEIQISENVPHRVWRTSLPVIAEELEAFGTPRCFRSELRWRHSSLS